MAVKFRVTIQRTDIVGMTSGQMNALIKSQFAKVGRWWHRVARPRHFERGAFQRYGYRRRSRNYNRFKKRKVSHLKPLVLSGETRQNSNTHRVEASHKGVTIVYPAVRKLNFRPKKGKINMRKEFETINNRELNHMTDLVERGIIRKIRTFNRTKRIRIGA